jgi:DNA-binding CsgD family transcriptional regulator
MALALDNSQTSLLTRCIEALDTDKFAPALLAFINCLVTVDSAVMLAYPGDSTLEILLDALDVGDRAGFDGPYRNGLYLLSPLYLESHAGRRGCFHISDIAPEGFTASEFYELYYSANDSIDQMAYLLETDTGTPVALSLERTKALPNFSTEDIKQLEAVTDLVAALVRQQGWQPKVAGVPVDMHAHLQQVLERFGSTVLTPREREVVRLILKGYPSKSVARELNISTQTEQVHRKNIYQKLAISSHSELFSLFFDAVSLSGPTGEDPLAALRN